MNTFLPSSRDIIYKSFVNMGFNGVTISVLVLIMCISANVTDNCPFMLQPSVCLNKFWLNGNAHSVVNLCIKRLQIVSEQIC